MSIDDIQDRTPTACKSKGRTQNWTMAAALILVLTTFAVSEAQAQLIINEAFDAPDTFKDPAGTADWDTAASTLHLPTTVTLPPVQSLTGSFLGSAISSAVDAGTQRETRAVAVGDLNGDGFIDLAFGNNGPNSISFNNGSGGFVRGDSIPDDGNNTRSVAIADFNGDGHLDVVFAEYGGGQATRVHFNNQSGLTQIFTAGDFVDLGDPSLKGDSVAAGDVDNDNDIDVVLGIDGGYVKLFRNDGFGNFAAPEDIADNAAEFGFHARAVLLGDLDRDGWLDLVAARESDTTRIYLNNGAGGFAAPQAAGTAINSLPAPDSAALGDVDGDGFLDLIVGNDGEGSVLNDPRPNYLFLNSGTATIFPNAPIMFADGANTNDVEIIDVDRDGDLDIVTADFVKGNGVNTPGANKLYINDPAANGANIFPLTGTPITSEMTVSKSAASGDFDRDGDLDLVFGNEGDKNPTLTATNRIVINAGVVSGTPENQLFATGLSLQYAPGANLSSGVLLELRTTNTEANKVFQYWLSDDGGLSWVVAQPNRSVAFPAPVGNDLRWRVELNSPSPALRPGLDYLRLRTDLPPSFTSIAVTAATQDVPYSYDITVDDPNSGDLLDIRVSGVLPTWLTLTDNGDRTATLAGTPLNANVGTVGNEVTLEVVDGAGRLATQLVAIDVGNTNDAPTVPFPTADQVFDQGDVVALDTSAAFDDADLDILTYSATGLPASLTLDANTGIVNGTLTNDDAFDVPGGVHSVVVTADDGNLGTVDDSFTITVNNINDAPTVLVQPLDQSIDQGTSVNLDISASFEDIDGDSLTYSATGLPASLSMDAAGIVTGTLTIADIPAGPDYAIVVTATEVGTADLFSVDASFTLTVVDTGPPTITLLGSATVTLTVGTAYTDAGATATDDVDGNITANIVTVNPVNSSVAGTYTITYNVSDSQGLAAIQVTRTVTVVDTGPPTITLLGSATVTLTVGTAYTDAGATATDDVDGDITANIVTVNPVNTSVAGTYTITYNVSDSQGLAAIQVTRTVRVNAAPPPPPKSGGGGSTSLLTLALLAGLARGRRRRSQLIS